MQTVKPARNQIFAKPQEVEKKTSSGFLLGDSAVDAPKIAEVINVGSDVKEFKSKDVIVYKSYATNDIKLNDTDFFLIDEKDVLGVVVEG